ncbi:unnamed protein product [Prunus armeniaca]|uniref:Uncharacterized protein n=1 Tax=Prunus armeniaca TaxID=36596 RepID=A0A6J5TZ58_PRUAR|nr:unnamed protein product [Prunus armeniaca]CAB4298875.1 unnamed protein product [Prunus armeniaca]
MNPYEDKIFCSYCYEFSGNDPQALLKHMIENHKYAPEVQGQKAADNTKRCTLFVQQWLPAFQDLH